MQREQRKMNVNKAMVHGVNHHGTGSMNNSNLEILRN